MEYFLAFEVVTLALRKSDGNSSHYIDFMINPLIETLFSINIIKLFVNENYNLLKPYLKHETVSKERGREHWLTNSARCWGEIVGERGMRSWERQICECKHWTTYLQNRDRHWKTDSGRETESDRWKKKKARHTQMRAARAIWNSLKNTEI